ncbi:U-box domain-containing protein 9-like [Salvia miltiorrhiza]|uniref:U-box domain-containing protein 9-like n=1 Tax=Salvia miltiorrhiza TaxID=226208 RepID=UPI0025ACD0D4|nr:U-box domain-containing protein 9-like [Salvia miltiorrhiza]
MEKIAGKETALELKKELQRVTEALMVDDDDDLEITDYAIQTLCALKELKLKQSDFDQGFMKLKNLEFQEPPQEFRCPISGILMKDPVVAASGQTFEELSIRKWLNEGNTKCPQTHQLLPHTLLIPNYSIKNMIINWCKATSRGDAPRTSPTRADELGANVSREHQMELLERLSSSSLPDQMAAVKELRLLTARLPSARSLFGEINGATSLLLSPLLVERCYSDAALYEDVVATILNISTDHSCKMKILEGRSTSAVSFLSEALRSKKSETRGHAAAALSALSTVDSNKGVIGELGAVKPLIKLLEEGHPLASIDAASAILNLCTLIENRERALSQGVVRVVIDKIEGGVLMNEMVEILERMCGHERAVEEMEERDMVSRLLSIVRDDVGERSKEKCVAIVYSMCYSDPRKLEQVPYAREALFGLTKTGTSRAKRKATALLQRLNRLTNSTHDFWVGLSK